MNSMNLFSFNLLNDLILNLKNHYTDNFDHVRFKNKWKNIVMDNIYYFGLKSDKFEDNYNRIKRYLPGFESFYNLLNDEYSKSMLISLVCYYILGHRKVKLPTNTSLFWEYSLNRKKINYKELGFPIDIKDTAIQALYSTFVLRQYQYKDIVKVEPGDTVIDCGACTGDTTLYFSVMAKNSGKVFAFEFEPTNISKFYKNIHLNESISKNITLIEKAVWDSSKKLSFISQGSGSKVKEEDSNSQIDAISIDEFVKENHLLKVDFIKMDIEGAESKALQGARETILRDKPKLAITIYHSLDDFTDLVNVIASMRSDYKFYIDHFTIHNEETVLFCR